MTKYQRAYFPQMDLKITQGYGSKCNGQHKYSLALDNIGKGVYVIDNIYAPYDCEVTKLYQPKDTKKHAPEVWLTSTKQVLARNGYYGYLTMSLTHPLEINKMKIGQKFKQGALICKEAKTGQASEPHLHLELSLGKKAGWKTEKHGGITYYMNINPIKPEEYLFLKDNANRINEKYKGDIYHFDKEVEITYYISSKDGLNIHSTKDFKKSSIIATFKYNDDVIWLRTEGDFALVYRCGILGWCSKKYLSKTKGK